MFKHLPFFLCAAATALYFSACSSNSDGENTGSDSGAGNNTDGDDSGSAAAGSSNGGDASAGSNNGGSSNNDAGGSEDGAAPGEADPVAPIPLADEDFDTSMLDDEEALQQLVGEYDVAIYYAPEDRQSDIGRGTVLVEYDGDIVHLALKGAEGAILVEVENSREDPVDYGQASFTQVLGKILVDQRDTPHERINVTLSPDGSIYGYVGGAGQFYQFRNNIVHYGPTPPPHLLTQAGTWSGPQLALTCDQPDVTVEIGADSSVLISGTSNLDCEPGEVENQWDGQDDFVRPGFHAGTVEIVIDSTHGGGSQATGGVWLTVPEDPAAVGLFLAKAVLEGFSGNLEAANLEQQ